MEKKMISDICFDLEESIKDANEEIKRYLDDPEILELIKKNDEHIKYLNNFRMRPGYDLQPKIKD